MKQIGTTYSNRSFVLPKEDSAYSFKETYEYDSWMHKSEMKKIILCLFIVLQFYENFSQVVAQEYHSTEDSIVLYTISDSSLVSVIDSFIKQEKNYCYFDDSCSFQIFAGQTMQDSILWVWLMSGFCANIAYSKQINRKEIIEREEYVVLYKKHFIFIGNAYSMGLLKGYVTQSDHKYEVKLDINTLYNGQTETDGNDDNTTEPNSWICFFLPDKTTRIIKTFGTMPINKRF